MGAKPICEQTHVILALPFAVRTARLPWLHVSGCPLFLNQGERNIVVHLIWLLSWAWSTSKFFNCGGWTVARNINMCNCDEADGKHAFKYHRRAQDQRETAHCSEMEATRKRKIEKICWFNWETRDLSFTWPYATFMWHAQHELWSRSWPMKSEHFGKPSKKTAMKRSLKSTFGSYFVESLLRLMQACAQTCGSGPEFQISRWCYVAMFCSSHVLELRDCVRPDRDVAEV